MCTASNRKSILSSSSNAATVYDNNDGNLMLPIDFTPGPKDILCGRGNVFTSHAGNRCFYELVHAGLDAYREASDRPSKIRVVDGISRALRLRGFRFTKLGGCGKDGGGAKRWRELSDVRAHQKIGHAIRDTIRLINKNKNNNRKSNGGRRKPMTQLSANRQLGSNNNNNNNDNNSSNNNNNNKSILKRKWRSTWFDEASVAPFDAVITSIPMTTDKILERSIETSAVRPFEHQHQHHHHQQQHYFTAASEIEVPSLPPRKRLERISSGALSLQSIGSLFLPNEYPDENCDFTAGCFFENYRRVSQ